MVDLKSQLGIMIFDLTVAELACNVCENCIKDTETLMDCVLDNILNIIIVFYVYMELKNYIFI